MVDDKPQDLGPRDIGPEDIGPKDIGPKDIRPKDIRPEEMAPPDGPGRARRAPPTIDLQAIEITDETPNRDGGTAAPGPEPSPSRPPGSRMSAAIIAAMSGAAAAALVIAAAWLSGWPGEPVPATAPVAPQANSAAMDDLAARLARLESKNNMPAAPASDPSAAARVDALEKALAALR